jgi:TRAP-type C4-dicarboxylate transport system permease small subunit
MNEFRLLAIALIVAGSLGLIYGGFTYTQDTQKAKIGSLELTVKDTKTVNVPIWAGVGAIVSGGILLFVRK